MNKKLTTYIESLKVDTISKSRLVLLDQLAAYLKEHSHPKLNFICTHNSRRSHLAQVWAQTMAHYFGVTVHTYSGGTEATAFHPNAVAALERAGFRISEGMGENPRYELTFGPDQEPMICFSKTFDDPFNPKENFAAIMTCDEANEACPIVPGSEVKIPLSYVDPKMSDGTDEQEKTYDLRCREIATEMKYVFSSI